MLAARERGVIFDIGHGKGSFGWKTARAMMAAGFPPDVISSDVHTLCINGPAYDQVTTMSKFLHLGMALPDIVAASTVNPAKALQRPDSVADASILDVVEGEFRYEDVLGEFVTGRERIVAAGLVVGGEWWDPA